MTTAYDYGLVALSIFVAMIAAYVSVDLASRVRTAPEGEKTDWLVAGAVVMGVGIWAMHFVGMLALKMPMLLGYDLGPTVISILPAIIAAGCVLHLIQRPILTVKHRLVGGLIMGSGIGAMHYTGMAAMVMSPPTRYDLGVLAASVVFAVAGSVLTIHLAHRAYAAANDAAETWLELISGVVGGLAIAGMHYLGMAATIIAPGSVCLSGFQGQTLPHHYNPWLVAMSVAIAIMSSYTALDVAARMRVATGKRQYWWLIGGGFAMGLGIWSMHFIGMIAMHTERPVTYELWTTLLSFVPAFAASTFALYMIQRGVPRPRILGLSGLLMGSGIGAMHYIGMAAMQIEPPMRYDPTFFTLSLLVAIAASVSALWIGFQQQHQSYHEVGLRKVSSAFIMGIAIAGMHYTGMSATHFLPPSASNQLAVGGLDPNYIAVFVGISSFLVLLLAYTVAFFDARLAMLRAEIAAKLHDANARLQMEAQELAERMTAEIRAGAVRDRLLGSIVEQSSDAIITMNSERLIDSWNAAAEMMFGYSAVDAIGVHGDQLFLHDNKTTIEKLSHYTSPTSGLPRIAESITAKDGSQTHVSSSVAPRVDADGNSIGSIAVIRNVTGEVLATQALDAEKLRAQTTLKSIGDAVIVFDANGKAEYMNPVAERLLAITTEKAVGKRFTEFVTFIHESKNEPVADVVVICFDTNSVIPLPEGTIIINAVGDEFPVEGSVAPIVGDTAPPCGVVVVLSNVIERRNMERTLRWQAMHDALTGLENRHSFEERLETALHTARSTNSQHTLLYVDLDHFKLVNDISGHAAGDRMLLGIAGLLQHQVRDSDYVARLGGDEFGILLNNCPHQDAMRVAENLCEHINQFRFVADEHVFQGSASIGVVPVTDHSQSITQLMMEADAACYLAKDHGRNRVWKEQLAGREAMGRLREMEWITRIDQAMMRGDLLLYCQPVVPLGRDGDQVTHAEILLRLVDEAGNLVSPGTFIPAAERYGSMPRIDRWVIETALATCIRHCNDTSSGTPIVLAVNISATTLANDTTIDFLAKCLVRHPLPQHVTLCLEVTETAAITNLVQARHFVHEARKLGCSLCLDDFGSGMSSFAYLKNLSVDYLKIDGSFIKDMSNDAIDCAMVEAIHRVGRLMGLKTIAEYVQDEVTVDKLRALGVDYGQGHHLARPLPFEDYLHQLTDIGMGTA